METKEPKETPAAEANPPAKTRKQLAAAAASAATKPEEKPAPKPDENEVSRETSEEKSAAQKLYEKRLKDLDDREKALKEREEAKPEAKEKPEEKPEAKTERKPYSYQKPDWEKMGYDRNESGELLDALDAAHEQIAELHKRMAELEDGIEEKTSFSRELSEARKERVQNLIASGLEKAAAELNETYSLDLDETEVATAFVKAVKGGLVAFNGLVDDPTPDMIVKSWKLLNADVIDGAAKPKAEEKPVEKKSVPQSKPSGERGSGEEGLRGKDRVKALLAAANPNVPLE